MDTSSSTDVAEAGSSTAVAPTTAVNDAALSHATDAVPTGTTAPSAATDDVGAGGGMPAAEKDAPSVSTGASSADGASAAGGAGAEAGGAGAGPGASRPPATATGTGEAGVAETKASEEPAEAKKEETAGGVAITAAKGSEGALEVSDAELARVFAEGRRAYRELVGGAADTSSDEGQAAVLKALQAMQTCSWLVRQLLPFSTNEGLDDVKTTDLKYLLVEFYIGRLLDKVRGTDRLPLIKSAMLNYNAYITRLDNMHAVAGGELAMIGGASMTPGDKRMMKINRFKQQKALEARSKELERLKRIVGEEGLDEEHVRELELGEIKAATMAAVDAVVSLKEERKMIEFMAKRRAESGGAEMGPALPPAKMAAPGGPLDPARPGLSLIHINPDFEMTRETFKAQVFRPGHRLPTMSLEEFADKEREEAIERGKREAAAEERRVKKYAELEELGLEDNEELVDMATLKERNWDDWKDDHPRGVGNTTRL